MSSFNSQFAQMSSPIVQKMEQRTERPPTPDFERPMTPEYINYLLDTFIPEKLTETSLFIPNLSHDMTEEKLKFIMTDFQFGIVERIDIILGKTQSGSVVKGGFVHFNEMRWYNTSWVNTVREKIQKEGMFKATHNTFGQFTFMYNTKPVAATPLNIHQLADALSVAEIAINKSDELNTKLSDELLQSRKNEENLLLQIKTLTDELNRQKSLNALYIIKPTPV
jgi:hypothetical protein